MAEVDLVPLAYRRVLAWRVLLLRFGLLYAVLVALLVSARLGLGFGARSMSRELEILEATRAQERVRRGRVVELAKQRDATRRRDAILSGLRGNVAAVDMFQVIDRASDGNVWFLDWTFRRAGEVVDRSPDAVETGYFLVVPLEDRDQRERAWVVHTHMEIRGRALDHSTLARFTRRLVEQPEIEQVRVLSTQMQTQASAEVVEYELAVVVRSSA